MNTWFSVLIFMPFPGMISMENLLFMLCVCFIFGLFISVKISDAQGSVEGKSFRFFDLFSGSEKTLNILC